MLIPTRPRLTFPADSSKPSSHMQITHSNTTEPLTSPNRPTSFASLVALPSEDAGVCVVCEDECTCGAAKSTVSSVKKTILTLPSSPTKRESDDDSDFSTVPPDTYASSSLASKKKRGRPSKADVLARQAVAKASTTPQVILTPSESHAKISKSSTITKKRPSGNNKSLSRAPGKVTNSRLLALAASDEDEDDEYSDHSTQFPTFLPASVLGSDLSSDDSDSLSSDDVDSAIEAEEEELIMAEETIAMRKLRARRETVDDKGETVPDTSRRWDKMNWNSRERRTSVAGSIVNDVNSNSGSDDADGDEADSDDDEDEDIDIDVFPAPIHDWSDEEEEYDADVFFANLSDSSFGSSSDSEPNLPTVNNNSATDVQSDMDSLTFLEASEDNILSPDFELLRRNSQLPLVVTEDWDGQLIFAHGMKDGEGASDVHFDTNARNTQDNGADADEADGEDTETESVAEDSETEGNTTDEEELSPGRPAPPVEPITSLDPADPSSMLGLQVSPPVSSSPTKTPLTEPPSSSDTVKTPIASVNASASPDPSASQSSATNKSTPKMGSFTISVLESSYSAIIDGLREVFIPSPYPRVKKQRDGWRGKKRSASGRVSWNCHAKSWLTVLTFKPLMEQSDLFLRVAKRPRQSSLPGTTRSLTTGVTRRLSNASDEPHVQSSPERPPPQPVELDDVLNAALLGDNSEEDSDAFASLVPPTAFFANLTRWDRVPISTFRRLRTAAAFDAGSSPGHPNSASLGSPRLADGFSYGSTGSAGVVSPYASALSSALWESTLASPSNKPKGKGREKGQDAEFGSGRGRSKKRKVLISPVIFPVKDDIANLSGSQSFLLSSHEGTVSKRQKREEDKKATGLFDSAFNSPPSRTIGLPVPSLLSLDH